MRNTRDGSDRTSAKIHKAICRTRRMAVKLRNRQNKISGTDETDRMSAKLHKTRCRTDRTGRMAANVRKKDEQQTERDWKQIERQPKYTEQDVEQAKHAERSQRISNKVRKRLNEIRNSWSR